MIAVSLGHSSSAGLRGRPVVVGEWLRSQLEPLSGELGERALLGTEPERSRCEQLELGDPACTWITTSGRIRERMDVKDSDRF